MTDDLGFSIKLTIAAVRHAAPNASNKHVRYKGAAALLEL